jgi:hypothetical protein
VFSEHPNTTPISRALTFPEGQSEILLVALAKLAERYGNQEFSIDERYGLDTAGLIGLEIRDQSPLTQRTTQGHPQQLIAGLGALEARIREPPIDGQNSSANEAHDVHRSVGEVKIERRTCSDRARPGLFKMPVGQTVATHKRKHSRSARITRNTLVVRKVVFGSRLEPRDKWVLELPVEDA